MKRTIVVTILVNGAAWLAFGQSPETRAKFEIVDVHVSPKTRNAFMRTGPARNGRYEVKMATMVDLIRTAYGFDTDKILGGPSWLELDRFDVIGKVPLIPPRKCTSRCFNRRWKTASNWWSAKRPSRWRRTR